MNKSKEFIRDYLDGFSFLNTRFRVDSFFSESETNIFSNLDRKKIWSPDGLPFCGDFDLYVKVYHNDIFQGFFRLEIFPWNEINLHIAFSTSNSFKSRYYLKTTCFFLSLLNVFILDFDIYCFVDSDNKNVLSYMRFFGFEYLGIENCLIRFKFNKVEMKNFSGLFLEQDLNKNLSASQISETGTKPVL